MPGTTRVRGLRLGGDAEELTYIPIKKATKAFTWTLTVEVGYKEFMPANVVNLGPTDIGWMGEDLKWQPVVKVPGRPRGPDRGLHASRSLSRGRVGDPYTRTGPSIHAKGGLCSILRVTLPGAVR